MPLTNKLHENFARLIAEGFTCTDAYRQLKPSSRHPSALGSRLWGRLDIRVRVSEIVEEADNTRTLTIQQKINQLEGQIRGKSPTKVKVAPNRRREMIYDMLGAIHLHSQICGDFAGIESRRKEPLLELKFEVLGRDEPLTPELEEEYRILIG